MTVCRLENIAATVALVQLLTEPDNNTQSSGRHSANSQHLVTVLECNPSASDRGHHVTSLTTACL